MGKGNMYEWAEPWNPLGGGCSHKCGYCSSKNFMRYPEFAKKYSGEPKLMEHEFRNLGYNKTLFVVAQNDLFAENVPQTYIMRIQRHCARFDNEYLFQSKNPGRMLDFILWFPKKSILCTTIESNRDYDNCNAPNMKDRAYAIYHLGHVFKTMVTIEPIMDFDLDEFVALLKFANPDEVNIGADSKRHNLPEPSKEKLLALIEELRKFTIIAKKTNLERLLR